MSSCSVLLLVMTPASVMAVVHKQANHRLFAGSGAGEGGGGHMPSLCKWQVDRALMSAGWRPAGGGCADPPRGLRGGALQPALPGAAEPHTPSGGWCASCCSLGGAPPTGRASQLHPCWPDAKGEEYCPMAHVLHCLQRCVVQFRGCTPHGARVSASPLLAGCRGGR